MSLTFFYTALVLIDPPRSSIIADTTSFSINDYIDTFGAVRLANKSPSYLCIFICALHQMPELTAQLQSVGGANAIKIRLASLSFSNLPASYEPYSQEGEEWLSATQGLVYAWVGKQGECTNKKGENASGSSLSFHSEFLYKNLYKDMKGLPVDVTELSPSFCRAILQCHTIPGDLVLDICSGSGAFATIAFSGNRSIIAVELDKDHCESIIRRLHACINIQDIDDSATALDQSKEDIGHCKVCSEKLTADKKWTLCGDCKAIVHLPCSVRSGTSWLCHACSPQKQNTPKLPQTSTQASSPNNNQSSSNIEKPTGSCDSFPTVCIVSGSFFYSNFFLPGFTIVSTITKCCSLFISSMCTYFFCIKLCYFTLFYFNFGIISTNFLF